MLTSLFSDSIPQELTNELRHLINDEGSHWIPPAKDVERIVEVLDLPNRASFCARLGSVTFIIICAILRLASPCLARSRGLCLLVVGKDNCHLDARLMLVGIAAITTLGLFDKPRRQRCPSSSNEAEEDSDRSTYYETFRQRLSSSYIYYPNPVMGLSARTNVETISKSAD